jgi:two-component system, OmpR family, sensor kinase
MRTPSLRRRVLGTGLAVFLLVVLVLEAFIALSLREQLERTLAEVLEARVQVARELARDHEGEELTARLTALGVSARVTTPDGEQLDNLPVIPRFGPGPPGPPTAVTGPFASEVVPLPGGGEIEVLATRAGVDATMRRVLLLMGVGTLLALVLGALLLRWATTAAIAPLGEIGAAARRTTEGLTGERLHPDDPRTELGRLAVAYDEMLDSLEDALERARIEEDRTRRFLDDAAHQLRTPIAGIRASVESLLDTDDPVQHDRLMANLVRETSRSARVLRDLLTMARLDAGRPPERLPTDLVALCADEVDRTRSLAPHLTVVCEGPEHGRVDAEVEPAAVQEVVANLLDNARRHAREEIQVQVTAAAHRWRIEVGDDGPGVEPEACQLIFERFATLDGLGGSGLGLPIARAVAEAHGGTLVYERGRFVLTLPRDVPDPDDAAPAAGGALRRPASPPPDA